MSVFKNENKDLVLCISAQQCVILKREFNDYVNIICRIMEVVFIVIIVIVMVELKM